MYRIVLLICEISGLDLVDGIGTGVVICPEQFSAEQQQYLVRRHIYALVASS